MSELSTLNPIVFWRTVLPVIRKQTAGARHVLISGAIQSIAIECGFTQNDLLHASHSVDNRAEFLKFVRDNFQLENNDSEGE